jgi:hypothetical protein
MLCGLFHLLRAKADESAVVVMMWVFLFWSSRITRARAPNISQYIRAVATVPTDNHG